MKLNIIKSIAVLSLVSSGMAGCLKDDSYDDHKIQSTRPEDGQPRPIELKVTANNTNRFVTLAYANSNNDTVVNLVPVTLATGNAAPEDINVTVGLKDSLVNAYNTANSTAYDLPTTSMFTVMNNGVVTIPKGSNVGYLQLKIKPSNFLSHDWALGFIINSVDKSGYTISGNLNTAVVAIATKNQWDGLYDATGYFQHPSSPRAINITDEKVKTVSATVVSKALGDLGDDVAIYITVNAGNTVTIVGAPGSTKVQNWLLPAYPEFNNTYNPATKTFMLCYGYPVGPSPIKIIREKLVYKGPR